MGVSITRLYYHKHNFLKYRVLSQLYKIYPERQTAREIALELGVKRQNVADLLSRWHLGKYNYCTRSRVGEGTKAYKYCITEFGVKTMLKYRKRLESGFSLNLSTVKKEDEHIGIGRAGVEAGMSYRDVLLKMKERRDSGDIDN